MKPGKSSLNPYAAAYIPLSRRNAAFQEIDCNSMGNDPNDDVNWNQQHVVAASVDQDNNSLKGKIIHHGSYGSTSQSSAIEDMYYDDKDINMEEEFNNGLKYLQMIFPGISEESLTEVFLANKGDLEATVEMLRQLEQDIDDCYEQLPESLDIGDVSEPGSSGVHAATTSRDEITAASALAGSSYSCPSSSHGLGTTDSKSKNP